MDTYSQLLERVAAAAGLKMEEVERKVEAKRAKLSGLVSKEGAAQIVAAELGVHLEKERMKISELTQGLKRASVVGKIIQVFPVRSYSKNGKEGKVGSFTLADDSANTRVVLWDTNHIGLLESQSLKEGDVVEISNAGVRNGEVHLSSFGDIKKSKEKIESVAANKSFMAQHLGEVRAGQSVRTRAFIMQVFEPRYFEVCAECGKKAVDEECKIHGKVAVKKRALLNIVLDDGQGSIRSVLFGEHINALGLTDDHIFSLERFAEQKESLLGEEKLFSGTLRSNTLYNTVEFSIDKVEDVNIDLLLHELETKA